MGKTAIPNLQELIRKYLAGDSLQSLSNSSGIGRTALTRAFLEAGVELRGLSAALCNRWEAVKSVPGGTERLCAPAWNARRGRVNSDSAAEATAAHRAVSLSHQYPLETTVAEMLIRHGHTISLQHAIGRYNADIALTEWPLVIEIYRQGPWHFNHDNGGQKKRIASLLRKGWAVIYLFCGAHLRTPETTESELISLINLAGEAPACSPFFGVVWAKDRRRSFAHYDFGAITVRTSDK